MLKSIISSALVLALLSGVVQSEDYDEIKTPMKAAWLKEVDLSSVPNIPIRPVGSGECADPKCDGTDNDLCFESCGNQASEDDIYGCPLDHHWALTFDDGPSNFTNHLLDILDQAQVKATFCVMGSHVSQYPEVIKRAYEAGHQIASHTFSHPHLMSLSNEEIIYEVKATEEAIEEAIGVRPRYIRPPYGEADDRVKALLKSMGYKVLLWNVDPTDYDVYQRKDASEVIQGSFKMAAAGEDTGLNSHDDLGFISLQHDLYKESIDQVPKIIQTLQKQGFKLVTAAECNQDQDPHHLLNAASVDKSSAMSEMPPLNLEIPTPPAVGATAVVMSSSSSLAAKTTQVQIKKMTETNAALSLSTQSSSIVALAISFIYFTLFA